MLPNISQARCQQLLGISPEELLARYATLPPEDRRLLEEDLEALFCTNKIPDNYMAWLPTAIPASWNAHTPHIELIGQHLDLMTANQIDRLAIHMPPRHSKSESITVRYPIYTLEREPEARVLITGHNQDFARKLSRKTRNVAKNKGIFDSSQASLDEWATLGGGSVMVRGVGSPPTGSGFDLIIIDDPIKSRENADSDNFREKCWDWYMDDISSRLEPNAKIILVMTRWHHDDLGYRIIESEPDAWTVLELPAIAEPTPEKPDPLGRHAGDALWPTRWAIDKLLRKKAIYEASEGIRSWNALYQQRPSALEGSFFEPDKIKLWNVLKDGPLPPMRKCVRWWDNAATKDAGNFTVGFKLAQDHNGGLWILDVIRGQYSTDQRRNIQRATAESDGPSVTIGTFQDPGAAGKDVSLDFIRLLVGYNVKTKVASGAKEAAAFPFSAQVNGGNVTMVLARWNAALKSEFRAFPFGTNDDIVDAGSGACNEIGGAITISTSSQSTTLDTSREHAAEPAKPPVLPRDQRGFPISPPRAGALSGSGYR